MTIKELFRNVSSHDVEGSFLDNPDHGSIHSVYSKLSTCLYSACFEKEMTNDAVEEILNSELLACVRSSFVVVYTMIFFNECCFTAVVPSVPFYLQIFNAPPTFLGWVVSFYSVGQTIGSSIGGCFVANLVLSSKKLLILSSTLGILSSSLYSFAPNHWFILASRLLAGISAGWEFTTELTFIARNTTTKQRTVYLAAVTAVNVVGFIIGPALGGFLATMDFQILGAKIDKYTGPGWLLNAMFLVDIVLVQVFFEDTSVPQSEILKASKHCKDEKEAKSETTAFNKRK